MCAFWDTSLFNYQSIIPPPSPTFCKALQRVHHCGKVIYHLTPLKPRGGSPVAPVGCSRPSPVWLLRTSRKIYPQSHITHQSTQCN
nr:MAG TPA: hypothetical protein [Caudoviricetes sp.]